MHTYKILQNLTEIFTKHGFQVKSTGEDVISVAANEIDPPICELIQYDDKHINMELGQDMDTYASRDDVDFDDLISYENSYIENKNDLKNIRFILDRIEPYLE